MVVRQVSFSANGQSHARYVNFFILSPSTQSERQFSTSLTISELKDRLEPITGIPAASQILQLQDGSGMTSTYGEISRNASTLAVLSDDQKILAEYGAEQDGTIIKVTTQDSMTSNALNGFVEDSNVKKYEMTDEEYANRRDTVMAYKSSHKIGRFASEPGKPSGPVFSIPSELITSSRVRVALTADASYTRLGTVRYVGETAFAPGVWVGIEYDEPVGKNDGSVEGERYFACQMKYGGFVRPEKCQVGDWPKEDEDDLELSEEE